MLWTFFESVDSRGPDPGLEVKVCQQTPILLALSAVTYLRRPKSHPKQYGRVLEPGFHTLRDVDILTKELTRRKFEYHKGRIGVADNPYIFEREC